MRLLRPHGPLTLEAPVKFFLTGSRLYIKFYTISPVHFIFWPKHNGAQLAADLAESPIPTQCNLAETASRARHSDVYKILYTAGRIRNGQKISKNL